MSICLRLYKNQIVKPTKCTIEIGWTGIILTRVSYKHVHNESIVDAIKAPDHKSRQLLQTTRNLSDEPLFGHCAEFFLLLVNKLQIITLLQLTKHMRGLCKSSRNNKLVLLVQKIPRKNKTNSLSTSKFIYRNTPKVIIQIHGTVAGSW